MRWISVALKSVCVRSVKWAGMALLALHTVVFAGAEAPLFYIEPYWHPTGPTGERFSLSWEYFLESDAPLVLREKKTLAIYRKGRMVSQIPLKNAEGLMRAELPDLCKYGSDLEVAIPFESKKRSVPKELCLKEMGRGAGTEPSRFVFLSDTQEFPRQTEKTLQQLRNSEARLILNGGDLVQTGSEGPQWQAYFDSFRDYLPTHVVMPIVGNHEYRYDPEVSLWERHFGGKAARWFYDFFIGEAQIIVLNSSFEDDPSLIRTQQAWLKDVLKKPALFKIVTMHHPPFSEGLAHLDLAPRGEHRVLREHFVPLFESFGVDLVLSGHTHLFERSIKSGIQYLISGAAGGKMGWLGAFNPYSLFAREVRTLSEVSVQKNLLEVKTWNERGTIEDRFVIPARSK